MEQLVKWYHEWARLTDGVIGVLTFGFVHTSFGLKSAKQLSKFRQNRKNLEIK